MSAGGGHVAGDRVTAARLVGDWVDPGFSEREIWIAVAGLMLGSFLQAQNVLVVITALPSIAADLGGLDLVAWTLSIYLLTITAAVPIWGKLGDVLGRQRLYLVAICVFSLASILCGMAQNMNQLIAARAVQGVGGAGLMVLPLAVIGDLAPPRRRGRYQAAMSANMVIATVLGPLIGGFFIDNLSWRWIFFINVPLRAMALFSATRARLPARSTTIASSIDVRGAAVLVVAAGTAMLVFTWGGDRYQWGSPLIAGLSLTSVALFGLLVVVERLAADPLIPLRLFGNRTFTGVLTAAFLSGLAMFGPWTLMPIFLQVVTGATATTSGLLLLPLILALTSTSVLSGHFIARFGRYKAIMVTGMCICTVGYVLYTTMDAQTSRGLASAYMVVTGLGLGMTLQVLVVVVQGVVPQADLGVATAALSFMRQLGGSFGTAITLSLFSGRLTSELARRLTTAEHDAVTDEVLGGSPTAIAMLPTAMQDSVVEAFSAALRSGFVAILPASFLAIVLLARAPAVPLSDRIVEAPSPEVAPGGRRDRA